MARILTAVIACAWAITSGVAWAGDPGVEANDNRQPAGHFANDRLEVNLVAAEGGWHPEGPGSPELTIAAFREEGGPLLTPGPLLRLMEGSTVLLRVRNALQAPLILHGLYTRPATSDATVTVDPGATRVIQFVAGSPGTYYYWASTSTAGLNARSAFDSQLGGAFVVDARGARTDDRIFVMTEWDARERRIDESTQRAHRVFAINGQSWPHTERLHETVGVSARWRWVNLTLVGHPMHLHGFYFTVLNTGTGLKDLTYAPEDRRRAVTERMGIGATMQMEWLPEREGNWLLHCHIIAHMSPALRFWQTPSDSHENHQVHDSAQAMAGLVLGVSVTGGGSAALAASVPPRVPRALTLLMQRREALWKPEDAMAFALIDAKTPSGSVEATVPGPTLVLTRGEPVEITLKNQLTEATAVHWHGIELESYYDGVPGFSGTSGSTTPAIDPGASINIRFTPPRAGTFIYHTHSHDDRQLASGLYGAVVVIEPGTSYDPAADHVVVLGMQGAKDTQRYERFPVVVNGSPTSRLTFKTGVANRIRLINITTNFNGINVSLVTDGPVRWRTLAKDGAELPASQQKAQTADRQTIGVGETYDFEVVPTANRMWLDVKRASGEWVQQVPIDVVR